jgi:hypothetical protein
MSKVAADRNIPPHNAAGTTAEEAYPFALIASKVDQRNLDVGILFRVLVSKSNLAAARSQPSWRKLESLVTYMLQWKAGLEVQDEARHACSQWLAMYHVSRKILKFRSGLIISDEILDCEADAEGMTLDGRSLTFPFTFLRTVWSA